MLSPRKLKANRRNARKSTGPRTAEGKAKSSLNAIVHGVFCRKAVLPGENKAVFDDIRADFVRSFKPQDLIELSLVERMAADQWRLMRLDDAEENLYTFRQASHQNVIDRQRAGKLTHNDRVDAWWEKMDESPDVEKEPEYIALVSAMGSAGMTMVSLMGDTQCTLERFDKMRQRLQLSIYRAMRQLDQLRAPRKEGSKALGPSPYCMEDHLTQAAITAHLNALLGEEEEEEAEADAESAAFQAHCEALQEQADEDEDDAPECPIEEASKSRNEPTADESPATQGTDEACDEQPSPPATAKVPQSAAEAVVELAQEHEDDLLRGEVDRN